MKPAQQGSFSCPVAYRRSSGSVGTLAWRSEASNFAGEPHGNWQTGQARILPRSELHTAKRALTAKYGNNFRVFTIATLMGRPRKHGGHAVGIEITLDSNPVAPGRCQPSNRTLRRGRLYAAGMSQPDLSRRVHRTEDDLTALADTIVGIQETVDEHTTTLAEHGRALGEIRQEQECQAVTLAEHGDQLTNIQQTLVAVLRRLDNSSN